jgi:peroxiredoxin
MARTPSTMMALGTPAPDFALPEPLTGKVHRRDGLLRAHGLLVAFICNHCPYVKHINPELVRVSQWALDHNIGVVFISSNDAHHHPADGPDAMAETARTLGYPAPYLYDESQSVARAFDAACTPDFFLFDADLRLHYRGRLDGATPGNDVPLTGEDLRAAMAALHAGQAAPADQRPSMGCNIKWR